MDADVDCHKSNMKQLYLSLTVKRILYLGNVLLRYVLLYNLEVSFNFHLMTPVICALRYFFPLLLVTASVACVAGV